MIKSILIALSKRKYLLAIISGLLMAIPLIYPTLFFLSWFSMVPFLYVLFKSQSKKESLKIAFCFSATFYLVSYSWFLFLHPLDWMGVEASYSLIASVLIWVAVSMVHTVCLTFLGLLFRLLKPQGIFKALVIASLWIAFEAFYSLSAFAFPWVRLALTQYKILPSIQSTAVFGSLFIGFIIVLVNGLFTLAIESKKTLKISFIITALSIYLVNFIYGSIVLEVKSSKDSSYPKVKVAAIQGNLNPVEKWDTSGVKDAFSICMNMSIDAAKAGAKIILWPETTLTNGIPAESYVENEIIDFVNEYDVVLVVGTFIKNEEGNHNSLITYYKGYNGSDNAYHKRHRVPFGEYIPQNKLLDWFFQAFPNLSMGQGIQKGEESIVYDTPHGKITSLICFDSVFPLFSAEAINKGADILLISTNDAYYRDSANPYQHKAHGVLRAVENNRSVLRSANTGISAIIDNSGNILSRLEYNTEAYLIEEVSLISSKTIYTQTGDIILIFGLAIIITSCGLNYKKRK